MKKIINFSLNNKLAIWLFTIVLVVAGIYSGVNMKMETIPNINLPIASITTIYPGATPDEISEKITKPLEQRLQNMTGVETVTSTSLENASSIQIEFNYDVNMDKAVTDIKEEIDKVNLPENAQKSTVSKLDINAFPIYSLSATAKGKTLAELTKLTENTVVPELESVDGVAIVNVSGQQSEEVHLTFDKEKLKAFQLDENTVQNIIKGSSLKLPLGLYPINKNQTSIVIDGNVATLEDLKNIQLPISPLVAKEKNIPSDNEKINTDIQEINKTAQEVATNAQQMTPNADVTSVATNAEKVAQQAQKVADNAKKVAETATDKADTATTIPPTPTISLRDIAEFNIVKTSESIARTNGKPSIGINIVKTSDANTVEVVNAAKEKIKEVEKDHKELNMISLYDQGKPIEQSVHTMLSKAVIGAAFAVFIILIFLRDIKTTIISIVSIPLSLLIAILALNQLDITLNVMTLGAMTVAIGRVIDDSIVVIENIYRRMSLSTEKLKGKKLIQESTREVFIPILSSTIVTIAVFLPLGLVKGAVGEMFLPFALTIVFSLLASLLIAITVVPMMAHSFFKKGVKHQHEHEEKPGMLARGYKKILNWTLNHKIITFGFAILLLVSSCLLVPKIGMSFLPSEREKMMMLTYTPKPGETLDDVKKVAIKAQDYFLDKKDVKTVEYSVGGENIMNPAATTQAQFFIVYDDDTKNFEKEQEKSLKKLEKMKFKGAWDTQSNGPSGNNNQLTLYVFGENKKDVEPVVKDVMNAIDDHQTVFKKPDSSLSDTYDQYTLVANQSKLSKIGLTTAQIGMLFAGDKQQSVLTTIKKDEKEVNVLISVPKQTYKEINDVTNRTLTTPMGTEVPIKDVVTIEKGEASNTIEKRDGRFYGQVSVEVKSKNMSKATSTLQKEIDDLDMPSSVDVEFGGVTKQMNESFLQLGLAILAAIAIVYIVLVITFGGGLAPFAILFSLPFTVIGALVALYLADETISVSAMIGVLMLIGIVVTNAIVLIDRVIHKENEGQSTREALLEAGATRLRPILMTAIATIGALIPLAIGIEGGGLISKGLGVTVIGGLTSSTLLTLVVVPIVYEVLAKFKRKNKSDEE